MEAVVSSWAPDGFCSSWFQCLAVSIGTSWFFSRVAIGRCIGVIPYESAGSWYSSGFSIGAGCRRPCTVGAVYETWALTEGACKMDLPTETYVGPHFI